MGGIKGSSAVNLVKKPRLTVEVSGETYRKLMFIAGYQGVASSRLASELLSEIVDICNIKTLESIKSA